MVDDTDTEVDESRMTLVEHLGELRHRLIVSLVALAVAGIVVFVFFEPIMDILIGPYRDLTRTAQLPEGKSLVFTSPLEAFGVRIKVAAFGGIALASPVIFWQLWRFVTPGLNAKEKRYAVPFLVSSTALFLLGAGLAWFTIPRALDFLLNIGGENLEALLRADEYLSLIMLMMLAFGVAFEFPILLVFLLMAGVVTTAQLRHFRRHTLVGIALFVAIITPSGDPISMMMLTIPLYLFYEATILVGRFIKR